MMRYVLVLAMVFGQVDDAQRIVGLYSTCSNILVCDAAKHLSCQDYSMGRRCRCQEGYQKISGADSSCSSCCIEQIPTHSSTGSPAVYEELLPTPTPPKRKKRKMTSRKKKTTSRKGRTTSRKAKKTSRKSR